MKLNMKKIFTILILLIQIFILSACSQNQILQTDEKIHILCTLFPQYDWVSEIIKNGEDFAVAELLTDNVTDMHSFQPSADDIIKIQSADIVVYVGGNSDKWIDDALKNAPTVTAINMLDLLGNSTISENETTESDNSHAHGSEADEHVWLSLRNAEKICQALAEYIAEYDSSNSELYIRNANEYIEKLNNLDVKYSETINTAKYKSLVFADRFPFKYMTSDYNISYSTAFPGCSAESEASFETVAKLSEVLDSEHLPAVIILDGSTTKLAETVIENTQSKNQKILRLNSLQSIGSQNENSLTYISVMEENLAVLSNALN